MEETIDENIVRKIAGIARLYLSEEEAVRMRDEMARILEHFKIVREIEGMQGLEEKESHYHYDMKNTMRDDAASKASDETTQVIRKEFTRSEDKHLTAPKSIK